MKREVRMARAKKPRVLKYSERKIAQKKAAPKKTAAKKPAAKNPVPPSSVVQTDQALKLFRDFTGHTGELFSSEIKPLPTVALVVGECLGVMYETVRDGKTERYLHKFAKNSRPLLCSSSDGKQLLLLGGAYNFTERGIVDRKN